jgi:iron complex transport system substrate-binding protein
MIGCEAKASALADELEAGSTRFVVRRALLAPAARLLRGMGRAADLVHTLGLGAHRIAGGDDVFPELAQQALGKHRILADALEDRASRTDLIFGSWCGKKFNAACRGGACRLDGRAAVRDGELHEVKSSIILQPGPAALTDGVRELHRVIAAWVEKKRG